MRCISRAFTWTSEARGGQGCAVNGSGELSKVYVTRPMGSRTVTVGQMDQRRECYSTGRERMPQVCFSLAGVAYCYWQQENSHIHSRPLIAKIQPEGSLRVHDNRVSAEGMTGLVALRAALFLRRFVPQPALSFPFSVSSNPFSSLHSTKFAIAHLPEWLWEKRWW